MLYLYKKRLHTDLNMSTFSGFSARDLLRFRVGGYHLVKISKIANTNFKVGLSPSKKNCVICFIESPLKKTKNAFYFILKALFVLKIFKFLSRLFGHVGKTA